VSEKKPNGLIVGRARSSVTRGLAGGQSRSPCDVGACPRPLEALCSWSLLTATKVVLIRAAQHCRRLCLRQIPVLHASSYYRLRVSGRNGRVVGNRRRCQATPDGGCAAGFDKQSAKPALTARTVEMEAAVVARSPLTADRLPLAVHAVLSPTNAGTRAPSARLSRYAPSKTSPKTHTITGPVGKS